MAAVQARRNPLIHWLDQERIWFPPLSQALVDPPGLLAAGGDLTPDRLLKGYSLGIFPWYEQGQPILWWSPDPRAVLFPGKFRLHRSLRKNLRNRGLEVSFDTAFEKVIQACAMPRERLPGTWITPEMTRAYCALYTLGFAHSVEIWDQDRLVGGLYGVAIGRVFFGESMFSLRRDASKAALATLAFVLERSGYGLLDCQMRTAHLESLGSECIPRERFARLLEELTPQSGLAGSWNELQVPLEQVATWHPGESIRTG